MWTWMCLFRRGIPGVFLSKLFAERYIFPEHFTVGARDLFPKKLHRSSLVHHRGQCTRSRLRMTTRGDIRVKYWGISVEVWSMCRNF